VRSKRSKKWHARKAAREAQLTADKALAPEDYRSKPDFGHISVHMAKLMANQLLDSAVRSSTFYRFTTSDSST
jgi:hypothetical protein